MANVMERGGRRGGVNLRSLCAGGRCKVVDSEWIANVERDIRVLFIVLF